MQPSGSARIPSTQSQQVMVSMKLGSISFMVRLAFIR